MTPGQVAFETFKECVGFYIPPWRDLQSERQAAWEAAANAVENELRRKDCAHCGDRAGGHDGTIWCAECFQWWCKEYENQEHEIIIADNERLRAALATLKYELETISNGRQEEVRNDFTSGEANGWTMAACHIGEIVTIALAPPAPDAVAAYRAAIRREAFLEAANLIRQTTPDPQPTDLLWLWRGGRMASIEQLETMAKREGRGRDEK